MRDNDQDVLLSAMQIEQQRGHHRCRFLIEVAGGLIAQEQPRFADERTRYGDALFLAAR